MASATFAGLGAGDYSVVASYAGDNNYKASNNSTKFSVSKKLMVILKLLFG